MIDHTNECTITQSGVCNCIAVFRTGSAESECMEEPSPARIQSIVSIHGMKVTEATSAALAAMYRQGYQDGLRDSFPPPDEADNQKPRGKHCNECGLADPWHTSRCTKAEGPFNQYGYVRNPEAGIQHDGDSA